MANYTVKLVEFTEEDCFSAREAALQVAATLFDRDYAIRALYDVTDNETGETVRVDLSEPDYDKPVTSVWGLYGHTFMGDGNSEDEHRRTSESCLTCGGVWHLVNEGDGNGRYETWNGDAPSECSSDYVTRVHGEAPCQNNNGRECDAAEENGRCEHTDHDCNCLYCRF